MVRDKIILDIFVVIIIRKTLTERIKQIICLILATLSSCCIRTLPAHAQELLTSDDWKAAMENVKPLFAQDTLTICFMGDIMMHSKQIETARRSDGTYDFSSYFRLIEDRISAADLAVANMEFTLSGEPYSGYPCFSAPDGFENYLADTGFDVFLAANNHIFDKGSKGAARTADAFSRLEKDKGIRFTGLASDEGMLRTNNPLRMLRKGIRIAFINFTYGTNLGGDKHWPKTNYIREKSRLSDAFDEAERYGADVTIALPHWGPEYKTRHSEEQEETAKWLVGEGADLIIGCHPHVVQDTASINGIPVVYSLGNAVSNMSATNTQLELMVTLRIVRSENGDLKTEPLELTWLWCSRPGGFCDSYTVIPVEDYLNRKEEWKDERDYVRMTETYTRISGKKNNDNTIR